MINKIFNEDCLIGMQNIQNESIDMILCDLPYGTSKWEWDIIIPFEALWKQYERIIKGNGAIVLTASQPFTSMLVVSNIALFRYEWIWDKAKATGHTQCNLKPLKSHENILVFYKKQPTYNPQKTKGNPYNGRKNPISTSEWQIGKKRNDNYGDRYPRSVFYEKTGDRNGTLHITAKPIEMFEMFIKTYTNEGETVLDNCIGSGTTAIACINTKRNYIGFEKDENRFNIIQQRIKNYTQQLKLI